LATVGADGQGLRASRGEQVDVLTDRVSQQVAGGGDDAGEVEVLGVGRFAAGEDE
jgi:hypothetical protein